MSRHGKSARPRSRQARRASLGFWATLACVILVALYLAVLELSRPHIEGDRLRLDAFATYAENGRIRNARILDYDSGGGGRYAKAPSAKKSGTAGASRVRRRSCASTARRRSPLLSEDATASASASKRALR